jgi:pimeloyl-ACP methyl ester carboxylesterase
LVHSPLVGPSSWRRTAEALAVSGLAASAVDYGGVSGPDWYGGAAARIAAALDDEDRIVLAVHSGAGGFAPALAATLGPRVTGFLFVDAVLPYPGRCWFDTAPPALAKRVREIAEDGVLPPWDTWFGLGAFDALIEDPAQRAAFSAELPRVPLAFLEAVAPDNDAWRARPRAYLQLSDGYAAEADAAAALGWIVRREALDHLAMLTQPDRVAPMLIDIAHGLATA